MSHSPDDAWFESLARELLHLDTGGEVTAARAIGERVVSSLFGGSFDLFQSRDPSKEASVERLADACGRSADWLSTRVRLWEQYPRYDAPFRDQVSVSIHGVLLRAPALERNRLLRRAAIEGLSVRELTRIAFPDEIPEPTPRPTQPQRLLSNHDRYLAEAERVAGKPEHEGLVKDWQAVIVMARSAIKAASAKPRPTKTKPQRR